MKTSRMQGTSGIESKGTSGRMHLWVAWTEMNWAACKWLISEALTYSRVSAWRTSWRWRTLTAAASEDDAVSLSSSSTSTLKKSAESNNDVNFATCVHVCIHVCIHVCMHICVTLCTRLHICVYIWLYVCMCVCMYVCMYVLVIEHLYSAAQPK